MTQSGPTALPRGLAQYARALAQIGAPPANVVVVEDDPAQAQLWYSRAAQQGLTGAQQALGVMLLTGTAGVAAAGLAPEPAAPPGWAVGLLSPQALSASAPARARVAVANDVDSFFIIWVQAWQIR